MCDSLIANRLHLQALLRHNFDLIHDDMKPANIANNEPHTWNKKGNRKGLGFSPLSLFLLFGPALLAVTQANAIADRFYAPM